MASLVDREVVGSLVSALSLHANLHQYVVEQRRCADAKPRRCHPSWAECLVDDDEVLPRLLCVAYAAGDLEADHAAGLLVVVADGFAHTEGDGQSRGGADLARRRLDEVGTG